MVEEHEFDERLNKAVELIRKRLTLNSTNNICVAWIPDYELFIVSDISVHLGLSAANIEGSVINLSKDELKIYIDYLKMYYEEVFRIPVTKLGPYNEHKKALILHAIRMITGETIE